jgi:hypothetical protein
LKINLLQRSGYAEKSVRVFQFQIWLLFPIQAVPPSSSLLRLARKTLKKS